MLQNCTTVPTILWIAQILFHEAQNPDCLMRNRLYGNKISKDVHTKLACGWKENAFESNLMGHRPLLGTAGNFYQLLVIVKVFLSIY